MLGRVGGREEWGEEVEGVKAVKGTGRVRLGKISLGREKDLAGGKGRAEAGPGRVTRGKRVL